MENGTKMLPAYKCQVKIAYITSIIPGWVFLKKNTQLMYSMHQRKPNNDKLSTNMINKVQICVLPLSQLQYILIILVVK